MWYVVRRFTRDKPAVWRERRGLTQQRSGSFKEAEKILSLEIRASGAEEAPPSSVFVGAEDGTLQEALVAVAAGGGDPAALAAAYD
ncbi:hypothetical protein H632_c585p2, partial [Helicosporidium sp. ATCC 50920]